MGIQLSQEPFVNHLLFEVHLWGWPCPHIITFNIIGNLQKQTYYYHVPQEFPYDVPRIYIYIDCYLPIKAYDYVPIYNNDIEHTKPHNHTRQD